MDIPECQLEQNVYGLIPDIPGIDIINKNIPLHVTPEDIVKRSQIKIDINTGYKLTAIKKLQEGLLRGSFRELYNPKYMPEFSTFVAGNEMRVHPLYTDFPISPYFKDMSLKITKSENNSTQDQISNKENNNILLILIFGVSLILTIIIIKKRNK